MQDNTLNIIEDFGPNDLLFGLEKHARTIYRSALETKLREITGRENTYLTVDDINKRLSAYIFQTHYRASPLKKMDTPVKTHGANWLMHETLHPREADKLFDIKDEKNSDRKFLLSCKVALATYPGTIRFCLDGLDLDGVRNPDNHKGYNSYTSEELRYVATNWDQLSEKVVFYNRGDRIDPPWGRQRPKAWLRDYKIELQETRPAFNINSPSNFKTPDRSSANTISRLRDYRARKTRKLDFGDENAVNPNISSPGSEPRL